MSWGSHEPSFFLWRAGHSDERLESKDGPCGTARDAVIGVTSERAFGSKLVLLHMVCGKAHQPVLLAERSQEQRVPPCAEHPYGPDLGF